MHVVLILTESQRDAVASALLCLTSQTTGPTPHLDQMRRDIMRAPVMDNPLLVETVQS